MSKFLFIINDDGNEYQITGTRIELDNNFVVDPLLYHETYAEDFYNYVKELVDGNNIVKYPKNLDYANQVLTLTNGDIIVTAITSGTSGNDINIELVDPGTPNEPLNINMDGTTVTITLGTDSTGIINTSIQEVADSINTDSTNNPVNTLIHASAESGVALSASAFPLTALTGGGGGDTFEEDDLIVTPMDPLDVARARARTKGKHILKQYCDFTIQFDFFRFQILNNQLIDAGYVITDSNREAKYLDIINTNDTNLIAIIEEYLEIRDRVAIHYQNYNNYQLFKNNVNNAPDLAAVDTAYSDFTALYG